MKKNPNLIEEIVNINYNNCRLISGDWIRAEKVNKFVRRLIEDLDFRIGHPDNVGQASNELLEIKDIIKRGSGVD